MRSRAYICLAAIILCTVRMLYAGEKLVIWLLMMFSVVFAVSLFCFIMSLLFLRVSAQLSSNIAERGHPVELTVSLKLRFPFAFIYASVSYMTPADMFSGKNRVFHKFIMPFKEFYEHDSFSCPYRGEYDIPLLLEIHDVFGFFKARVRRPRSAKPHLTILPFVNMLNNITLSENANSGDSDSGRHKGDSLSVSEIRPWHDGDHVKQIHWKLSARSSDIIVREYEGFPPPVMLVFLDLSRHNLNGEAAAIAEDNMTGTAASICAEAVEAGYETVLICRGTARHEIVCSGENDVFYMRKLLASVLFDGAAANASDIDKEVSILAERPETLKEVRIISPNPDDTLSKYALSLQTHGIRAEIVSFKAVSAPEAGTPVPELNNRVSAEGMNI